MTEFKYRPDVDGLRAVAVVLVVLFHAGLGFTGGFIGVDVFFVISGFLITGLISKELARGQFSLTQFWVRRIRRILPAATVMVLGTLLAGFFLLLPNDYEILGESTIAQQLMHSNNYFRRHIGYFSGPADLMPLLHTWSLAVEEQFYLGYPMLLVLAHRLGRKAVIGVVVTIAIISLVYSQYQLSEHPSAAFFLLPSRAWEMLLGGMICFMPHPTGIRRRVRESLSWLSLATILATGWLYTSSTPFPGLAALVPCFAAALLIYTNAAEPTQSARLLSAKPIVFVGLISYSLYLWHWPVLAFYRYSFDGEISVAMALILISLSVALAVLSWRFVERPFRHGTAALPPKRVFIAATFVSTGCLLLAIGLKQNQGLPMRVSPQVLRYQAATESKGFIHETSVDAAQAGEFPSFGPPSAPNRCLLWGDSHAMALMPGLSAACDQAGVAGFQATHSSTPPVIDFVFESKWGLNEDAPRFNQAVLDFVVENEIQWVFLSGVWSSYATKASFETQLSKTVQALVQAGVRVGVVLDVANQGFDVPRTYAKKAFWNQSLHDDLVSLDEHRDRNRSAEEIIHRICADQQVIALDPATFFVDRDGTWNAEVGGELMYRDATHLSVEGGLHLKPLFHDFLRRHEETATQIATETESQIRSR